MKRIIRQSIFETNSSSTHSLTIMTQDQWKEFEKTDKWLADYSGKLHLVDDLIPMIKKYYPEVDCNDRQACIDFLTNPEECDERYYTYDTWGNFGWWESFQTYEEEFETPSGDKMIAVGIYGYDG